MGRVREYELVVILSPALGDAEAKEAGDQIQRFITDRGGTVTAQEPWGQRRLAYPIRHYKEGNYVVTRFSLDGDHTSALTHSLKLSEHVLRHLLVKVES